MDRESWGWALAAVGLGCVHLFAAGAPMPFPAVNAVAGIAGLAAGSWLARSGPQGVLALAAGLAVLAVALFGVRIDGVARWVAAGPIRLQPGLILVPPLIVAHARRPGLSTGAGLGLALAGLALQPDRGTAGAAALALAVAAGARRDRATLLLALAAASAFAVTWLRPDPVAPVRYVEGVFAAAAGSRATMALLAMGALAMLAPAPMRLATGGLRDRAALAFAAIWAGLLAAAALGPWPTPVLGYGASGVLGFVLSLAALGRRRAG